METFISRHKIVHDACQAELSKQTRYLDKWQTVNAKNICQEEHQMRKQLKKLQRDKLKYHQEGQELHKGKWESLAPDSYGSERHSFTSQVSGQLPVIADNGDRSKETFHERKSALSLSKPKSHRQLKLENTSPDKSPLRGTPKGIPRDEIGHTKLPKIQQSDKVSKSKNLKYEKRKAMPADEFRRRKEKFLQTESEKKTTSSVPTIVISDKISDVAGKGMNGSGVKKPLSHTRSHQGTDKDDKIVSKQHTHGEDRKSHHQHIDRTGQKDSRRQIDRIDHKGSHHGRRGSIQYLDHSRDRLHETDRHHVPRSSSLISDTEEITSLYDMAIETVSSANEFAFSDIHDVHRRNAKRQWKDHSRVPDTTQMDLSSLHELESMLKEARQYNTRKQKESDYGLHTSENRAQRRRLHFLEEILQALSDDHEAKFDPMEMLQCGYLRLSKSNVERLENMVREKGGEPGIHAHSDVSNMDIWAEIKREKQEELERENSKHGAPSEKHV